MKTVLFLCSGNYYRSRFAEVLFNARADDTRLPWRAVSRGFFLHAGNVGPISQHAIRGLETRGVVLGTDVRFPIVVTEQDLEAAHHIVAVKESEHRPQLEAKFPDWASRVEFWKIDDLDCAEPEVALVHLEQAVVDLMGRLVNYAN
jgi:protein-tyrosine phosphatase